jgi:hypothetical protein
VEQGAQAANLASAQQAIQAVKDKEDLMAIAARRPELRSQILNEIYSREIQKAQVRIQQDAQSLYEQQFGLEKSRFREEKRENRREHRLAIAGLRLETMQELRMAREAERRGREIDASASRLRGYLVDQHGRPILGPDGKRMKVKNDATGQDRREAYREAVDEAKDLKPEPMGNPNISPLAPGKYIAKPGAKGVFPPRSGGPATTNNPAKARMEGGMGWAEALRFLTNRYGISRKAARRALIAAGYKAPRRGGGGPAPHQ